MAACFVGFMPDVTLAKDAGFVEQAKLGNIFYDTETVEIWCSVSPGVASVSWTINDYWKKEVKSGTTKSEDIGDMVIIKPEVNQLGFYEINITAGAATFLTSFAVVADNSNISAESRFGAMTHFGIGWNTDIIPLIAKCGIKHIRDEMPWANLETTKNVYEFIHGDVNYDAYMKKLEANKIDVLMIMAFGNPRLYDNRDNSNFSTPYTDNGRLGYANYGKAILNNYAFQIIGLDVWNEYNGGFCTSPATNDRPAYYTAMLKNVNDVVHPTFSGIPLVGTACVGVPKGYLHDIFIKPGAHAAMDKVSIHPYSYLKSSESELNWLKKEILTTNGGTNKPIWATEFGNIWDFQTDRYKVASYNIAKALYMCTAGVEKMFVYLFRDYNEFAGLGLVKDENAIGGKYTPNPCYPAYSNLIKQMNGAIFTSKENLGSTSWANVYKYNRNGNELRTCWTEEPTTDNSITFNTTNNLIKVDIMGVQTTLTPEGGNITLTLDQNPVYIIGNVNSVTMNSKLPITDSDLQYSMQTQGKDNWYYGYFDGTGTKPYTDANFKQLTSSLTQWDYVWGSSSYAWLVSSLGTQHPSTDGSKQVWNVKRWVSPISGNVHVIGSFKEEGGSSGDGVVVKILVDGVSKFSQPVHRSSGTFDLTVKVYVGSKLDFCVTPGSGTDTSFDNVQLNARIYDGSPTSIDAKVNKNDVMVYPNPFDSEIRLENRNGSDKDWLVSICNVNGIIVFQHQFKSLPNIINTSDLPKGAYLLNIVQGKRNLVYKIVK